MIFFKANLVLKIIFTNQKFSSNEWNSKCIELRFDEKISIFIEQIEENGYNGKIIIVQFVDLSNLSLFAVKNYSL